MKKSVTFDAVCGNVTAPPSKSVAQRALAISLLKNTDTELFNICGSEDIENALGVIRMLGACIKERPGSIIVSGGLNPASGKINVGESGLAVRMFSPIISLLSDEMEISGKGSLLSRPVSMIESPLRQLGVDVLSNKGYLPMKLRGPISGNFVNIDGSVSSQFLTGMLIAKGQTSESFRIKTDNLKSRPYVDLTINMMKKFGVEVLNNEYAEFVIREGQKYNGCSYNVEGDWSGASFFIAAAACGGEITISNLDPDSSQADRVMIDAVKKAGADVVISGNSVTVRKNILLPFDFDASECPDLFPPLVSLASNISGRSVIKGVHRLKHKESDRGTVLKKEFAKLGIDIIIENDSMVVNGGSLVNGKISSNNDHRIAMAGAVAAAGCSVTVEITESESVNKSYSRFFDDLVSAGGRVE